MPMTLVEAAKRSNNVLQKGVLELFIKDDPILQKLQFKDIKGNGLTYNEETTLSDAQFYAVNDTWVEGTSTITPATAVTQILGGDADVDNFLRITRGNMQDLMAEQIDSKTKAIKRTFLDMFWYGDKDNDLNGFNGLHNLINRVSSAESYNTVPTATSSGTPILLSLERVEEALDAIKNGSADVVVMTKLMRRYINKYLNGVGGITKTDIQGETVQTLFEVPIVTSDHLSNDESCDQSYTDVWGNTRYGHNGDDGVALGDDDNGTSIFCLQFGPKAVCGIQSLAMTTEKFKKLETKDASRVRIKWYPGLMFQSLISSSKVTGISPTGTVTA
jgi:hypothetical protein